MTPPSLTVNAPQRGEIWWVRFDPATGAEIAKTRPARVMNLPAVGRLPFTPDSFVERSPVVNYPTNFAAMSDEWIDRLSARGEQLTRVLVKHYLPGILD